MPAATAEPRPIPMTRGGRPARLCVFGAAPDTGNLGVSALGEALLGGLWARLPSADLTVFDHQRGVRPWAPEGMPRSASAWRCGAVHSRRLHRPESLWRMWAAASWGLGPNAGVERVRASDAVLDVSGGDSFTDLYGPKRFRTVAMPKRIALELGRPLVLLPQTYGPFASDEARREAEAIVRSARAAWARDARSFEALRGLLGDHFDPARHACTVDLAFGLTARAPRTPLPEPICSWLDEGAFVALNVSGLIANDAAASAARFGLRADYREAVSPHLGELLDSTDERVVLVPHVHAPLGHPESDLAAALELLERVPARHRSRVGVLPGGLDAGETKWVLARAGWACATRMHACIGALSSGVPVAGLAYSDKARGVFECCGQGGALIDPRLLTTDDVVDAVIASYHGRAAQRLALAASLPGVLEQNAAFFDDLAAVIDTAADAPAARRAA